jgi:hypothetical protein
MTKLEFIRGVLKGAVGQIDLSEYISEGEFCVYMQDDHVHRYLSSAAEEDVDLDDPGMYMDAEDDENMIIGFLQKELISMYQLNKQQP